ncbi:MAG: DNA adenine methylase [Moorella sp. (in: firmicutes)]
MGQFHLKPIVKWAGGKFKLINQLLPYFPAEFKNYHEPFLGSGAVFFSLFHEILSRQTQVLISDLNSELINLYEVVRDDVDIMDPEI